MKKIIYLFVALSLISCNENSFLQEKPKDFMSSDNSFITETDFNMSVNNL